MTVTTTVRYQGNALTDTFNADGVQCLTLQVKYTQLIQQLVRSLEIRVKKHTNYKNKQKFVNTQTCKRVGVKLYRRRR